MILSTPPLDLRSLTARDVAELLYLHGVGGLIVTAVASTSLVLLVHRELSRAGPLWLSAMLVIVIVRAIDLAAARRRRREPDWDGRAQTRHWAVGVMATAIVWMLFPISFFAQLTSVERVILAVIMSAMAGGSATVLAASLPLAITYCAALLVPASIMFLITPGHGNPTLGALGIVFFLIMVGAARITNRSTLTAIRLNRTNAALLAEMERERGRSELANVELRTTQTELRETLDTLESRIKLRTADLEREIRERERYSRDLARLASSDPLTGLANRTALIERLGRELERAAQTQTPIAVLFVDLDHFKEVNNVKGHEVGDAVLRAVAQRLAGSVPAGSVAARWGGDEFVIVLTACPGAPTAHAFGTRLRGCIAEPIAVAGEIVRVDGTIGIAAFPDHGREPDELIRAADMAMYAGKRDGCGRVRTFDPALADAVRQRHLLEQALREATADGSLRLVFQPIVAARSRRCHSFEALLRWDHPRLGAVEPVRFIPVAERSGEIIAIGRWALDRACATAASWSGPNAPAISVNVSVAQIAGGTLIDDVRTALERSSLPPHRLQLELTESLFADDVGRIVPILTDLRAMGVRIALDDFGTGFSSLGTLRSLPVDTIKIDKAFVSDADETTEPIIRAIAAVCRALRVDVVAEGVETRSQAKMLAALNVQYLQGFCFAAPLEASEVGEWLGRNAAHAAPTIAETLSTRTVLRGPTVSTVRG